MGVVYADDWLTVHEGDNREVLRTMPEQSVHTCITSPPYYALRDYGVDGQIGLEATPDEYVASLVNTFREVKRVLRDDGTLWLNLGDSYNSTPPGKNPGGFQGAKMREDAAYDAAHPRQSAKGKIDGLKPKDLIGIPWRVAFALQQDGWYLRSDIVWSKPNPMPESIADRPTKSHEYVFLLSKKPRYFYDGDAVREPISEAMQQAIERGPREDREYQHDSATRFGKRSGNRAFSDPASLERIAGGRNMRSVWTIPTTPYPGAHFATFPPKLVEPCVKAGTSETGVCEACGSPWTRVAGRSCPECGELVPTATKDCPACGYRNTGWRDERAVSQDHLSTDFSAAGRLVPRRTDLTPRRIVAGWQSSCGHDVGVVPATVLDPFAGSGTTGMVAQSLSRRAVLIDLNGSYLLQALERNAQIPIGL